MSTFSGKIQEFPGISVDRFDSNNEQSEVYFLSHCHTDHMVGLSSGQFQRSLIDNGKYLFGSPITCIILKKMYPDIKNNLKELSLYLPTNITLKNSAFSVTTIPAGHCPGSVMFLFEGKTRILYTGDFRIHKGDIRKFKSFYDPFTNVKSIDKIYLDTTFFFKEYLKFPKREDSLNELCVVIKEWLDMGSLYMINLITSAKYGYEYLFIEIYRKLGMPIHINQEIYNFYCLIPEMDKSITTDRTVTRIHSSCGPTPHTTCSYKSLGVVKPVKVSAFRWNQEKLLKGMSDVDPYMHYVCYSTHASYEEAVDLIQFLKPKEVEICVKPSDPLDYSNLKKSIEEVLEAFEEDEAEEAHLDRKVPKLFKMDDIVDKKEIIESDVEKLEILEEDELTTIMNLQPDNPYGHMLDSPPRGDMKVPTTDVLTTIMDLSPVKGTLKGIIKRKEKSLKRERSFTLLQSVPETSSCSNQWEGLNSEPHILNNEHKLQPPSSGKYGDDDYKGGLPLDNHELNLRVWKELSASFESESDDSDVVSGKMNITDSNEHTKKSKTMEIYNEFVPQDKNPLSANKYTKNTTERTEPIQYPDNDEFDLAVRTAVFADESIMDGSAAKSQIIDKNEPCENDSEKLSTERNFLLELIESEPGTIRESQTIANESETVDTDCSALYDLLGISPPQK
nr:unnamed protein product [Callosobruchus analis]